MSDSDDDSFQSKVSTIFPNNNKTMFARGPKVNNINVTGLSLRNNRLAATMDMPVNFERDRYGDSLSLRSAPTYRPPSYSHSSYQYGLGSHRSMYNGRDESSTSIHSVETTASVISAANIVCAFNNGKLNKYDLRSIKDACNKLMKTHRRKRIEKRRKLKLFFKGMRRKSGEDSGEQGSDSSISDDCRSVRTTIYKENIPDMRHTRDLSQFSTNMQTSRHRMLDASHFSMNLRDNRIFTDCTESIKQSTMRNIISTQRSNIDIDVNDRFLNSVRSRDCNPVELKSHSRSYMTQNERYNKELLLPPQNLKKNVAGQKQDNNNDYKRWTKNKETNKIDSPNQEEVQSDSDQDQNQLILTLQNTSHTTQKERFKKGFLLPSQRFNKNVSGQKQDETKMNNDIDNGNKKAVKNKVVPANQAVIQSDSDHLQNTLSRKLQNTSQIIQKEQLKKGFVLPSERFNTTTAGHKKDITKLNNNDKRPKKVVEKKTSPLKQAGLDSDSDQEEIIKEVSFNQKNYQNGQRKRALNTEEASFSYEKRIKLDSQKKPQRCKTSETSHNNIPKEPCNDFIFAKPKVPVKKGNPIKALMPEKLLAKSRVPPIEEEIDFNFEQNNKSNELPEKNSVRHLEDTTQSDLLSSNSDVSMRPSFIRRKLFTQNLDVAEKKNASSDNIVANSPQNIYSASNRERNKARKLVTSQSCLSREINGEDNNVLDLIHIIVPPDQINITNVANKSEPVNNRSKDIDNTDKWDVSTIIANCDNQDISDTYTDEEIFHVNGDKKSEKPAKSVQNSTVLPQCHIVVEKLKLNTELTAAKNSAHRKPPQKKIVEKVSESNKLNVADWMKSFWDTDSDSDLQFNVGRSRNMQQNQATPPKKGNVVLGDKNIKTATNSKGTILSFRNFHKNSKLNDGLKSHRNENHSNKQVTDINKPNIVDHAKSNTKVETNNKDIKAISQTGKKDAIVKEHVPVEKNDVSGRKPKTKQCVDCSNTDKPTNKPHRSNKPSKLTKDNNRADNKENYTKNNTNHEKHPTKTTLKSQDSKNSERKQSQKESTNKVSKSGQKTDKNVLKEPVRTQPKRKSKEKSFVKSPKLTKTNSKDLINKKTNKTKSPNNKPKIKSTKLVSNNTSINNTSMTTRSRSKLFNHSMGSDYSSINLSNISNRTLRFR